MRMKTIRTLLTILPAALWACGGGEKPAEPAAAGRPKERAEQTSPSDDGHDRKHEEGQAGPNHEEASGGHEHGKVRHDLGEQKAGAWTASAQQADDVVAGGETVFYVTVSGAPKPAAVRLWVGDEQASVSTRVLGEWIDDTRTHAHVEIPGSLAPADQFWIEIDDGKGSVVKAAFKLPPGAVLPPSGPRAGFVVPLNGPDAPAGFAELKLHDDKGDLELWLATDAAMTTPLDLPLDTAITVAFPDKGKSVELRVRNKEKDEDEDGKANVRNGKTNYFIFPGATGADSSWLMGNFRSTATIQFSSEGKTLSAAPFTLAPHTHGPGGHSH